MRGRPVGHTMAAMVQYEGRRAVPIALALLALASCASDRGPGDDAPDGLRVAPPTGTTEADRGAILAALEQADAGARIQFQEGTYLIGDIISVPHADITLLAHPDGTTLRGCEPEKYPQGQQLPEAMAAGEMTLEEYGELIMGCGIVLLTGGGVTVRGFTIEYTRVGICLSVCASDPSAPLGDTVGGYRIENNTFRNSGNGVRGQVVSTDTSVIGNNRFVNTFHAVSVLEGDRNRVTVDAEVEVRDRGVGNLVSKRPRSAP